jgi:DNA-binding response OmpR family regulator
MDGRALSTCARALRRLGHEVSTEEDSALAMAHIEADDVRVVIGDGRLPKFGWMDLCLRLRENPAKPYVYFILLESRHVDESHEEWAGSAGVDDFIDRPADERELRRRLRRAASVVGAPATGEESGVPVCTHCHRVQDEQDHWQALEGYVRARLGTQFSAAICPDCYIKNFGPEFHSNQIGSGGQKKLTEV